jgi:hypothetical protein
MKYPTIIFIFIINLVNLFSIDHINEEKTADALLPPQEPRREHGVWLGLDIGMPGYVNVNTGIVVIPIGLQAKVGLIYPYYKAAEGSLLIDNILPGATGLLWEAKLGYVENKENIYRYIGVGITANPNFESWFINYGLSYFYSGGDVLYPVLPYIGFGYTINTGW